MTGAEQSEQDPLPEDAADSLEPVGIGPTDESTEPGQTIMGRKRAL